MLDGGEEGTGEGLHGQAVCAGDLDQFAELRGFLRLDLACLVHEGLEFGIKVARLAGHDISLLAARAGTNDSKARRGVKAAIAAAIRLSHGAGKGRITAACERTRKSWVMLVQWTTDDGEMHHAKRVFRVRGSVFVLYLKIDGLGESGWDWHIWEQSGQGQQRYGLADDLSAAKAKAEVALDALARELGLTA